ncbi:hypothetical protein M3Y98_01167900 [Aphelenchoides besseyi]|nr:hypothetical protein M3Y98_01167900 [Aphelenchoides besseyi]
MSHRSLTTISELRQRLTNSETLEHYGRRIRYFTYRQRKPILITIISVVVLLCFFGAILTVILTKTSHSRKTNPNATLLTFAFHLGRRDTGRLIKKRSLDQDPVDLGEQVLRKTIQELAERIRNESIIVNLIPYADNVLEDRILSDLSDYDLILSTISRLFKNKKLFGSQSEAMNYYLKSTEKNSQSTRTLKLDAQQSKGNFVFLAPQKHLYTSPEDRLKDSTDAGALMHKVLSLNSQMFLVGLDNDTNMITEYGLEDSNIQVLPNGPTDVDKIVHGIESGPATTIAPILTTTLKTTTMEIKTSSSTTKQTTVITTKRTTTTEAEQTTEFTTEFTTEYASSTKEAEYIDLEAY